MYRTVGYWLSFGGWIGCGGRSLSGTRIYRQRKMMKSKWTPFVKLRWTAKQFRPFDIMRDLLWILTGWRIVAKT